jgi:hypothetical protein
MRRGRTQQSYLGARPGETAVRKQSSSQVEYVRKLTVTASTRLHQYVIAISFSMSFAMSCRMTGVILEIASGLGEHVVHFARNFPSLVSNLPIQSRTRYGVSPHGRRPTHVTNVRTPIVLDASQSFWSIASADGIICINMVHISPWDATLGLIKGAAAVLPSASPLYLFGPYKREGFASASQTAQGRARRARVPARPLSQGYGERRRAASESAACLVLPGLASAVARTR